MASIEDNISTYLGISNVERVRPRKALGGFNGMRSTKPTGHAFGSSSAVLVPTQLEVVLTTVDDWERIGESWCI